MASQRIKFQNRATRYQAKQFAPLPRRRLKYTRTNLVDRYGIVILVVILDGFIFVMLQVLHFGI